ncbi:MAG: YggT family protein [Gemmatimonadota bacterium]|nr:MAG: YggT family protein [Gemmatimonadota bacterium]
MEPIISIITLYEGLILLRALVSWFVSPQTSNQAIDLLKRVTDPVLDPVRNILPASSGIDLSPLIVLIGLELLKRFLT